MKLHSVLVYLWMIHKLNFANENSIRIKIEIGEEIGIFRMNDKYTVSDFFINSYILLHRLGDRELHKQSRKMI